MSIFRVKHDKENPYVMLNKKSLWDEALPLECVGLWARLMSRPDNWTIRTSELARSCSLSTDTINKYIRVLMDAGYVHRIQKREPDEKGKFPNRYGEWEYWVFESKHSKDEISNILSETVFSGPILSEPIDSVLLNKESNRSGSKDPLMTNTNLPPTPKGEDPPTSGPKRKETSEAAKEIAQELWNRIKSVHPGFKSPNLSKWAEDMDKALRIDCRSKEELLEVIRFAFEEDPFWVKVLQSAEGLRRNFDKIWVKARSVDNNGSRIRANVLTAREARGQLGAENSPKAKQFFVSDKELVRLDTGERISLALHPKEFEKEMLRIFQIRKMNE